jgi:hypothetical protein
MWKKGCRIVGEMDSGRSMMTVTLINPNPNEPRRRSLRMVTDLEGSEGIGQAVLGSLVRWVPLSPVMPILVLL